jgi:hypothetical protein
MLDMFASVPKDARAGRLKEYRDYLIERDGELDLEHRTLARREVSMKRYETPPEFLRELDEAEFRKQYATFDERKVQSKEMLLLLALVKINSAEAYGVSRNFDRTMNRALRNEDDSELRILCEEGYHTRILLSSANRYGIELHEPYTPPSALRAMIGGIATAPMAVARPLTLAGEIIATLMFTKLIAVTERVLEHDPETRDAILERIMEICVDERGHISYNRLHMGPADLAQARLILPLTARIMSTVFSEMVALGAYPTEIMRELPLITESKHLPAEVNRQSFVA